MVLKTELQKQALELSQMMIEEWYRNKTDRLMTLLDDNVTWIGATASQFYRGKSEVTNALETISGEILPCNVSKASWYIADKGADWCLCIGKYIWTISDEKLSEKNRILQIMTTEYEYSLIGLKKFSDKGVVWL